MNENDRFLRMALRGNASFSALCALLSLFAAEPIAVVMAQSTSDPPTVRPAPFRASAWDAPCAMKSW